jgi:hypothetical protein
MLNQPQYHTYSLLPHRRHLIPFTSLLERTHQFPYHPRILPSGLLRLPCGRDPLGSPDLCDFKSPPGRLCPSCSGFSADVRVWREREWEMEVGVVPE